MRRWLAVAVTGLACGESRGVVGTNEGSTAEARGRQDALPALVVSFGYDPEGRLTSLERADAGTTIAWAMSTRTVTDAEAGVTTSRFSPGGALEQLVDPRGVVTDLERDGLGHVASVRSADTGLTRNTFDEAGLLREQVDARGVVSALSWDAVGRLVRLSRQRGASAAEVFTWTWDDAEGGTGRLLGTTFPGGRTARRLDATGALTRLEQQVGGVTTVASWEYDLLGRVVALRYPSGRRLGIEWRDGAPVALRLGEADAGTTLVDGIVTRGSVVESMTWHLATGPRPQVRRFDSIGRVVEYPLGEGTRALDFDLAGRVVAYRHLGPDGGPGDGADLLAGARDETFIYDRLDRLVGFTRAGESVQVRLDAVGNRAALEHGGTARWMTEPTSNRLLDAGVAYDEVGNVLGDGSFTATYDLAGRLASFTRAGVVMNATSDGDGHRVRKSTAAGDLVFLRDPAGHLLGEYDEAAAAVREYLWLGDVLVGFFLGAEFFFVQVDHLGAPRVAIDVQGRARWTWLVSPFGDGVPEPLVVDGARPLGAFDLPLRFPGQYADVESGLFHNHHREYDPATGRYLQADPLGLEGGVNPYVYVGGDPINAIDPQGLARLNLFAPGSVQHGLAERDPDLPGMLTVHGHGTSEFMLDEPTGRQLDAKDLAQRIRESGQWKPGMFVRLVACNVGQGGKESLVWKLAQELGAPVTGPDSLITDFVSEGYWYPTNTPLDPGAPAGRFITVVPRRRR